MRGKKIYKMDWNTSEEKKQHFSYGGQKNKKQIKANQKKKNNKQTPKIVLRVLCHWLFHFYYEHMHSCWNVSDIGKLRYKTGWVGGKIEYWKLIMVVDGPWIHHELGS